MLDQLMEGKYRVEGYLVIVMKLVECAE